MSVKQILYPLVAIQILFLQHATAQSVIDKSILCNKKWATHANHLPGEYPDLVTATTYDIFFEDGTGERREIDTEIVKSKFTWKIKSNHSIAVFGPHVLEKIRTIGIGGKIKHYTMTIRLLKSEEMVCDNTYYLTDGRRTEKLDLTIYYKRKEDLIRSIWSMDSLLANSKRGSIAQLMQISETADNIKFSAYFPARFKVTNYQTIDDKVFFSTEGAGLLVQDRENRTWSRMDITNTPGIPLIILSVKDDRQGGLWFNSYGLSHWTPKGITHYYVVHNGKIQLIVGGILGHGTDGNVLGVTQRGGGYSIDVKNFTMQMSETYVSKLPTSANSDCGQLLQLHRRIATVKNDSIVYADLKDCLYHEFRTVFDNQNDLMHIGECVCELKGGQWKITKGNINEIDRTRPHWRKGVIGINAGSPGEYSGRVNEGVRYFALEDTGTRTTVTESHGIWESDLESRKHAAIIKYKFASPEEILSDAPQDSAVWLMSDIHALEKAFDVFTLQSESYRSTKFFFGDSSTTRLRVIGDSIFINTGTRKSHVIFHQITSGLEGRDNFAIDFESQTIWIATRGYLHKFELNKKLNMIRKQEYYLGIHDVSAIKQIKNKLLIFSQSGLGVINLDTLD